MSSNEITNKDNNVEYSDPLWVEDYEILYHPDRLVEFFPTNDMTMYEKMNAVFRLSIYLFIIYLIARQNVKAVFLPLFVAGISLYIFKNENGMVMDIDKILFGTNKDEINEDNKCILPTKNNAFMNVMNTDYGTGKKGHKSCDIESKTVKDKIKSNFSDKLYKDVSDVYSKTGLDRQFYSNPNNLIPNDQKKFALYLYGKGRTCKEDTTKCDRLIYEDPRRNAVKPQDIPRGST